MCSQFRMYNSVHSENSRQINFSSWRAEMGHLSTLGITHRCVRRARAPHAIYNMSWRHLSHPSREKYPRGYFWVYPTALPAEYRFRIEETFSSAKSSSRSAPTLIEEGALPSPVKLNLVSSWLDSKQDPQYKFIIHLRIKAFYNEPAPTQT